jgi:MYXO-CTERM domain-containing protein
VGAYWDDERRGAAYVFVRDGSSWNEEQKLVATDGAAGHRFGGAVSLGADRAVVGAYARDAGRGAAYVFALRDDTWSEEALLVASDGINNDLFGWSVALAEDRAHAGAYYDDNLRGAAYVFSPGLGIGVPCFDGDECTSGVCEDAVCCDAPCDGACEACTAALKGEGEDGTCGAIVAGDACMSAPPDGSDADSGCACRAGRSQRKKHGAFGCVALALLGFAGRRRRR